MRRRAILPAALLAALLPVAVAADEAAPVMHPAVTLLDVTGTPSEISNQVPDAFATCSTCHDAAYVQAHSSHTAAGAEAD